MCWLLNKISTWISPLVKMKYLKVFMSTLPFSEKPFEVVHKTASNHSITISWRKVETAKQHAAYVVEWYPDGPNLEELRWIRLDRNDSHVLITGRTE